MVHHPNCAYPTSQLSVGPEAALSLLVGQVITEIINNDPHSLPKNPDKLAATIAAMMTFQVGIITFFLGIMRLGYLDILLNRPLLRGFITAIVSRDRRSGLAFGWGRG